MAWQFIGVSSACQARLVGHSRRGLPDLRSGLKNGRFSSLKEAVVRRVDPDANWPFRRSVLFWQDRSGSHMFCPRITLISPILYQSESPLTQEKVSTGGSSLSKLKQTKYILAILVIVIVVAAAVTAVFFLPKASALKVDVGAGPRIRFLGFNVNNITDVRVRQAIAYAVDRDAINTNVFLGLATPIYSMIPPSMPYNQPVFKTKYG